MMMGRVVLAFIVLVLRSNDVNAFVSHLGGRVFRLSRPAQVLRAPTSSRHLFAKEKNCASLNNVDLHKSLDRDFAKISLPAFASLAADPISSIVDAIYVARLGPVQQAAMGIAISAQFSVAKLYNDPLLKTSTSLVAGKEGESLEKAVTGALFTAVTIGLAQSVIFFSLGHSILRLMGVSAQSEMLKPAISYLKWRSLGVPAGTVLLVANGIFRGRGDTRTPLYCTLLGTAINVLLDPLLIFTCGMGCAGAGAAIAVSNWCAVVPLLYVLNKAVPLNLFGHSKSFFTEALQSYFQTGSLMFLRTGAKISTYSMASAAAARLGTVAMAAYSLTFNLGFATSQLCEAIAIASQALIGRYFPFKKDPQRLSAARHIIRRSVGLGLLVSSVLSALTYLNQHRILSAFTRSPEVHAAAVAVMPIVLVTQLFKALEHSTSGIIMGGQDWKWSSLGASSPCNFCCFVAVFVLISSSVCNTYRCGGFVGLVCRVDKCSADEPMECVVRPGCPHGLAGKCLLLCIFSSSDGFQRDVIFARRQWFVLT